jgi:hypothetical protein
LQVAGGPRTMDTADCRKSEQQAKRDTGAVKQALKRRICKLGRGVAPVGLGLPLKLCQPDPYSVDRQTDASRITGNGARKLKLCPGKVDP